MWMGSSIVTLALFIVAIIVIIKTIRVVPQQHALVIERLGRFHAVLAPGLNFVVPVRRPRRLQARPARNSARRAEPDLHHQGQHAAPGRRHPVLPGHRPEARVLRLEQLHASRSRSSRRRRCAASSAGWSSTARSRSATTSTASSSRRSTRRRANWGVKVLRYEIKDLTPPKEILHAMQAQITAEREKRAVIATSEGTQQEQINLAAGARAAAIAQVRRREAGGDQPGAGPGGGDPRDRRGERQGDPPGRRGDRRAGRRAGGEPQGRRAIRRRLRQSREDEQHADRAVESVRSRRARSRRRRRCSRRRRNSRARRLAGRDEGAADATQGSAFVVTGGASGLGAAHGADGRRRRRQASSSPISSEAEGKALARELGAAARFVRTDVTDEASAQGGGRRRAERVRRAARPRQLRRHRPRREGRRQGRAARARGLRAHDQHQPDRLVQHDAARRRRDERRTRRTPRASAA